MADEEDDDLENCWRTLRGVAIEKAASRTVSTSEAIHRIIYAIQEFVEVLQLDHQLHFKVVFQTSHDDEWMASIDGAPQELVVPEPEYRKTITEALHVLFTQIHDAIYRYIVDLREETVQLKTQAGKMDSMSYRLERIRQAMGGYEPHQCTLPFPPMDAKVLVRSYVGDMVVKKEQVAVPPPVTEDDDPQEKLPIDDDFSSLLDDDIPF